MQPSRALISMFALSMALLSASPAFARGEVYAAFSGTAAANAEHPAYTGCVVSVRVDVLRLPADPGDFRLRERDLITITVDPKRGECPRRGQKIQGTLVFKPCQYHGDWDAYYGQNLEW